MKKIILIIVALIAMFIGVGGILPALAKVRDLGAIPGPFIGSYTLGVFLVTPCRHLHDFHLVQETHRCRLEKAEIASFNEAAISSS